MIEWLIAHEWYVVPALVGAAIILIYFTNREPDDGYEY